MFGSASALQPRRKVRRLADDAPLLRLPRPDEVADHHQSGGDADPRLQRNQHLESRHRRDGLKPGAYGLFGIVLVGLRIAEIDEHAVAQIFGDETAVAAHRLGDACLIGRNQLAQVFGVHLTGECGRTDKIGKHDGDLATLGGVLGLRLGQRRLRRHRNGTGTLRNRFQQLLAMAERHDADVLEIVVGQLAQQLDVDVVSAEHLGILGEADPAEPTVDVHVQSPGSTAQLSKMGLSLRHRP